MLVVSPANTKMSAPIRATNGANQAKTRPADPWPAGAHSASTAVAMAVAAVIFVAIAPR